MLVKYVKTGHWTQCVIKYDYKSSNVQQRIIGLIVGQFCALDGTRTAIYVWSHMVTEESLAIEYAGGDKNRQPVALHRELRRVRNKRVKATEPEIRELARSLAPDCIKRLWEIGKGKNGAAVRALEVILERGLGKVRQQIDINPLAALTDEQVELRYLQLQQQLAQEQAALPSLERVDSPGDPSRITK